MFDNYMARLCLTWPVECHASMFDAIARAHAHNGDDDALQRLHVKHRRYNQLLKMST